MSITHFAIASVLIVTLVATNAAKAIATKTGNRETRHLRKAALEALLMIAIGGAGALIALVHALNSG